MKLAILIIIMLIVFWYLRRIGVRTAKKGRELQQKLRRQALNRAGGKSSEEES